MSEKAHLEIAVDSRGTERNIRSVRSELEGLERVGVSTARTMKVAGVAIAAVAATTAAGVGILSTATAAVSEEMRDLVRDAEALGSSAGTLSEWQYAARSMGIEADKVGDIFKDVNDKIGDFVRTGGGEAADIFEQLGLSAQDFIGLRPEQAILRISNAMDGLTTGEKTFFMESLADDASRLIPLLDDNAERFRALVAEGREFGTIVTTEQAKIAQGFEQMLTRAGHMSEGFKTQLGIGLAPAFEGVLNYIDEVTDGFGGPAEAAQATARAIVQSMHTAAAGVATVTSSLQETYDFYLQIRELEAQASAIGGTLHNIATNSDELPQGFTELQRIRQARADLAEGGIADDVIQHLERLLEHIDEAANQSVPRLNESAVAAAVNVGVLANSARESGERVNEANSEVAEVAEDQAQALSDTIQPVRDFADTVRSSAATIAQAISVVDPRYDIKAGGDTIEERARSRFEASAFRIGDPSVTNFGGNPDARPTTSLDYLSTARGSTESLLGSAGAGRVGDESSQDPVVQQLIQANSHLANIDQGGSGESRNLGTLTLASDGGVIDVEANAEALNKWLAATLSSAAASV